METHPEIIFRTLACVDKATGALTVSEGALAALSADIVALTNILKHAPLHPQVVTERRDHLLVTREVLRRALFPDSPMHTIAQELDQLRKSQKILTGVAEAYSNYSALLTHGIFTPLVACEGPYAAEHPEEFPRNMEELFAWTECKVTALLDFYDIHLPVTTSVAAKKAVLLRAIISRA